MKLAKDPIIKKCLWLNVVTVGVIFVLWGYPAKILYDEYLISNPNLLIAYAILPYFFYLLILKLNLAVVVSFLLRRHGRRFLDAHRDELPSKLLAATVSLSRMLYATYLVWLIADVAYMAGLVIAILHHVWVYVLRW